MADTPSDRAMMPDEDTEKTSSITSGFPPAGSFSTYPSEDEVERKVANDLSSDREAEDSMALPVATITAQAKNATEDPATNTADDLMPVPPHHAATPRLSPDDIEHVEFLRQHHPHVLTRTGTLLHEKPAVFCHDREFEHPAVRRLYHTNSPEPSYDGVRYRPDVVLNYAAYYRGELPELESFIKPTIRGVIANVDSMFPLHEAAL